LPEHSLSVAHRSVAFHIPWSREWVVLFGGLSVVLALMLWPSAWTGNEEDYFQLAHRRIAPERFSEFHAVFDHSSGRIVPESVLGALVHRLGYEKAHVIARLGMALLYAAGLSFFFKTLGVSLLDALLVVVVFRLMGEQLIGAEWLFKGVEAKTLAYAVLFAALAWAERGRWMSAVIASSVATYLHPLVGGFWTLVIVGLQWWRTRDGRQTAKTFAVYLAPTLPLLVVIAREQLEGGLPASLHGSAAAAEIYAVRNSHHLLPFLSVSTFWTWLPGIVVVGCLTVTLAVLVRRKVAPPIALAALIGLVHLLLALGLSFLDRHTYLMAKVYLFRPSSLTLFLVITSLVIALKTGHSPGGRMVWTLVAASVVVSFSWTLLKGQVDTLLRGPRFPYTPALVAAIQAHSRPSDIVLVEPVEKQDDSYLYLHRVIPRPTLVTWKFVPTNAADTMRWYTFLRERERIFTQGCGQRPDPPVRLLVAFHQDVAQRLQDCGPVVWRRDPVTLIEVAGSR
jgi:hypothetical protein